MAVQTLIPEAENYRTCATNFVISKSSHPVPVLLLLLKSIVKGGLVFLKL